MNEIISSIDIVVKGLELHEVELKVVNKFTIPVMGMFSMTLVDIGSIITNVPYNCAICVCFF